MAIDLHDTTLAPKILQFLQLKGKLNVYISEGDDESTYYYQIGDKLFVIHGEGERWEGSEACVTCTNDERHWLMARVRKHFKMTNQQIFAEK